MRRARRQDVVAGAVKGAIAGGLLEQGHGRVELIEIEPDQRVRKVTVYATDGPRPAPADAGKTETVTVEDPAAYWDKTFGDPQKAH